MRTSLASALAGVVFAFAQPAIAQTLGCVGGGTGGPVPTSGTGGLGTFPTQLPPFPGVYSLNVSALPPGASVVSEVRVLGFTHTYAGDLHFVLTSPSGEAHNLLVRRGGSCDFAGDYVFVPGCAGSPLNPWTCSFTLAQGAYEQFFGLWPDGASALLNTSIASIPAQTGVWTLSIYDWAFGDIGNVSSWELCFGAAPAPASNAPFGAPLTAAPQDGDTLLGPTIRLEWFAEACATAYDVEVDGQITGSATSSSFNYTATPGAHQWRVRGRNSAGVGPWSLVQNFTSVEPPPGPCSGAQLTTLYASNIGSGNGGIVYFDLDVVDPAGIVLSQLDTNVAGAVGQAFALELYRRSGSYSGFEQSPAAWTLVSTGGGLANGVDLPTRVDMADVYFAPGSYGIGLAISGAAHAHTSVSGGPQAYSDVALTIRAGAAQKPAFTGQVKPSRVWNGTWRYNCPLAPPSAYCTAGVTTNGCAPAVSASAQPSASLASACQIDVVNLEGQRQGLIFYGVDNSGFSPLPWDSASTSYLCVKPPAQRAVAMNSGGASGQCDGVLALDWNAFQSANPGALGSPFSFGAKVYVQGWFRDPPAPRGSNLSNAIELTVGP